MRVASHPELSSHPTRFPKKVFPKKLLALKQNAVLKYLVNQTVAALNAFAQLQQCHDERLHDSIGMGIDCDPWARVFKNHQDIRIAGFGEVASRNRPEED